MRKKAQSPPRKVVKAKGALPSPVVAPKRVVVPWYRRRTNQAGGALLLVLVIWFAVTVFGNIRDGREQKRREVRAVLQFERKVTLLNAPLAPILQTIQTSPDAFLQGDLPPEEFKAQANGWLEGFRKLYNGVKGTKAPAAVQGLVETRGLFAQSAVLYVDAAKAYVQAASVSVPEREAATSLARNLLSHAGAVASMGERQFQKLKNELQLNDPVAKLPPVPIPAEQAPLPAPVPAAPVPPGATPQAPAPAGPSPAP